MSKIPQGEWNAIATRYAKGESISRIAQSYDCTPPAIHYILKRNGQRSAGTVDLPSGEQQGSTSTIIGSSRPRSEEHGPSEWPKGDIKAVLNPLSARPLGHDRAERNGGETISAAGPARGAPGPAAALQQPAAKTHGAKRAAAFTAGLDSELHNRAEAAIEAFRSSFDAALAEGSPVLRERLRQAASDLMRVAARTTIVLERLNAGAERANARLQDYPRSAHVRGDAERVLTA